MNRKEYIYKLQNVLNLCKEKNTSAAKDELDKLEGIYPKSLGHYLAVQRIQFDGKEDYHSPFEGLAGKYVYVNPYLFLNETLNLFVEATKKSNNIWGGHLYNNIKSILSDEKKLYNEVDAICAEADKTAEAIDVCEALYESLDAYAYAIHRLVINDINPLNKKHVNPSHIYKRSNMGYFSQDIKKRSPMILIETEDYSAIPQMLLRDLQYCGNPICYVKMPTCIGIDEIKNAWNITLSSIQQVDKVTYITPVSIELEDGSFANNVDDIIRYVKDELFSCKLVGILGEMQYLEALSISPTLKSHFYKITSGMMTRSHRCLNYALYGEYLTYISKVYDEDIEHLLKQNTEVKFSIVIPARNSTDTLRYTLQTCLNQTFRGSYEIIVSDNSTGQNPSVYNLCKKLNDSRIVYIKTPRDLHLPKSFEFAYTHAKGEYIFAIGSDDGLLPWALEEINKVIEQYPEETIIQWERGFYAWPGFNGGQQNQMIVPREYKITDYEVYYKNGLDYIAEVMFRQEAMYNLPMLYINSCFKRDYFKTLIEKTGRLWDGVCQDVYMGVVTAIINPNILNIRFPMTIAGMSSRSVGANANLGVVADEEFKKLIAQKNLDGNVGGYYETYYERLIPMTGTDTYSLYKTLLRMISIGLLPESYISEVIPWKDWYIRLAAELNVKDLSFDAKIHEMRYCASLLGEEFLTWFDKGIYEYKLRPVEINETPSDSCVKRRTYDVGTDETGKRTLDASEYGVTNIYEAVQLFSDIINNKKVL